MVLRFGGKNLLFFKDFDLEFSEGLNVITGETGAGKSILLRGLQALLGKKVEFLLGEDTWLEALILVKSVDEELREIGIKEGEHVVSLSSGKRWIYRIDGKMYPQAVVERLFEDSIHFHQQNSHVNLLKKRHQLSLLDRFCDNDRLLNEYKGAYQRMQELLNLIEGFSDRNIDQEIEELDRQLLFFEKYKPNEEEERSLKERFERISKAKQLTSFLEEISETLNDDILARLWRLVISAEKMSTLLPQGLSELLRSIVENSNEVKRMIHKFVEEIQIEDASEIEARLAIYNELRRRFGPDWENIKKNWMKLEQERKELLEKRQQLYLANKELVSIQRICWDLAQRLHERRIERAVEFEREVQKHLKELAMNVDFLVKIGKFDHLTPSGISDVEFVIKLEGGELRSLRDVLSGGELSRMVLAVQLVITGHAGGAFVFDEIDSGIGGITGNVLGEKLKSLSNRAQVIVVTHLPQVARHADRHFFVEKDGTDSMNVRQLSSKERKDELLRMIGGKDVWGDVV
ncbi:AAA family ATPase [Pseudothermotoga sp.]|nr:AAA family ATPase [Pseudothermotoga sp.]MDW8139833.1 AAA family ATPase [Pseudothermotoga sp.]